MRQSQLFTKTRREAPKEEVATNAKLLIRAGYINKEMAGVYSYLPLGLRVFKKIENIIRAEMNKIGGQEIVMTALQESSTWEPTDQWDDKKVDVWFKTKLKNDTELGLAVTHEAAVTRLVKDFVNSYRDLPFYPYQFQTKFRNETRAKSGIIRCREFVMKDLYSFSRTAEEHDAFYERAKEAYKNIFSLTGIGHLTYLTAASGGMFSKFSHEFQTLTEAGEDIIYVDEKKGLAINREIYTDEVISDLGLKKEDLKEKKAVEVGNIFPLGTRFSDALNLKYKTETGEEKSVIMGSYGIGPGRLMGTIVEVLADDKGLVWPKNIAPFVLHIVSLGNKESEAYKAAEKLYQDCQAQNIEVFFDDRDAAAGEKFADADLLGMPYRVVVSDKTLKEGKFELKERKSGEVKMVAQSELMAIVR